MEINTLEEAMKNTGVAYYICRTGSRHTGGSHDGNYRGGNHRTRHERNKLSV